MPALPTFRSPPVASSGACRPTPRITKQPSPSSSTPAPSAITALSVERVSSESRKFRTVTGSSHIAPNSAARWEIDLSAGGV